MAAVSAQDCVHCTFCRVGGYLVAQAGQPLHCLVDAALGAAHLAAVAHTSNGLLPSQHIHANLGVILRDTLSQLPHTAPSAIEQDRTSYP